MKNTLDKIAVAVFGCLLMLGLFSCEKHDLFDENTMTGDIGPQAYWEIGSSMVNAGSEVPFTAQYYSTVSEIDHSEVWYKIEESLEKNVSCPWVTTFTYDISSSVTEEKRISQKIQEYPHELATWNDSLHAYYFESTFPVSYTLSAYSWSKPATMDTTLAERYFGQEYMQHFKDSLYTLMQFDDFQKMFLGLELLEDFKQYTDSTLDENAGENVYTYHFPKNEAGETPVPEDIRRMYEGISFYDLIFNTSTGVYDIEYKRSYGLEAVLRVYDTRGVYGTTIMKEISIN